MKQSRTFLFYFKRSTRILKGQCHDVVDSYFGDCEDIQLKRSKFACPRSEHAVVALAYKTDVTQKRILWRLEYSKQENFRAPKENLIIGGFPLALKWVNNVLLHKQICALKGEGALGVLLSVSQRSLWPKGGS